MKFNLKKIVSTPIYLIGIIFFTGCSLNKVVVNYFSDFAEDGIDVLYEEGDLVLAGEFLTSNLKVIEIMLSKDPENKKLNLIAAQGFGAYAFGFVEDSDPERASKIYKRAINYSFRALPEKLTFDEKISPNDLEKLLQLYTRDDVPVLFWLGYNWGLYILQNLDDPKVLVNLSKVEMIMSRVLELDEEYNFAGVHLFYGAYYSARPPMLGGNPEKGREHFLRNLELTGNEFLLTKYFYARYYAFQVQDKVLFDQLLNEIIETDIEKYPDVKLMNAVAKKKAKILKQNENKFF
jgi:hypothetical protein